MAIVSRQLVECGFDLLNALANEIVHGDQERRRHHRQRDDDAER